MSDTLYIFAVTAPDDLRHTHLTRAAGEAPDLPPLTEWLGAEVDAARIELFPLKDLGDMSLSEYVTLAFAAEPIAPPVARRMNAIKGHVLLVPEQALSEEPAPGKEAVLVATVPLAAADQAGRLPKADMTRPARPATPPDPVPPQRGPSIWVGLALGLAVLILLALVL